MARLVPAIHVLGFHNEVKKKTWMPGTRPGMTRRNQCLALNSPDTSRNSTA
jgi:hypothetical protein